MKNNNYLSIYLIVNDFNIKDRNIFLTIEELFQNGVTTCQIRIKNHKWLLIFKILRIKRLCRKYNVKFIINDHILYSKILKADGIHLGQQNLNQIKKYNIKKKNKILGISAYNKNEILIAKEYHPDYIGIGSVYKTTTKVDAKIFSDYDDLKELNNIPFIFIGGLTSKNIEILNKYNYSGLAFSNYLLTNPNNIKDIKKKR